MSVRKPRRTRCRNCKQLHDVVDTFICGDPPRTFRNICPKCRVLIMSTETFGLQADQLPFAYNVPDPYKR